MDLRRADRADRDVAVALRLFAHVRAQAGTELDEAEAALPEAMARHITVLTGDPDQAEYVAEIYTTELVQSLVLTAQGRPAEARRVAELARSRHLDALPGILRAQHPR